MWKKNNLERKETRFLRLHLDLKLEKPKNTSATRAAGFDKVSVRRFFELRRKELMKPAISPEKIYGVPKHGRR